MALVDAYAMVAVFPVPSWPAALLPQHRTVPVSSAAHVCVRPEEMALTPSSGVDAAVSTVVGVDRWMVVPSPRRPLVFSPQHRAVPSESRAHVCDVPADIWVAGEAPRVS